MRTTTVTIPEDLTTKVQTCQVKMDGLKQLIGFLVSTIEYDVPKAKIDAFQAEFMEENKVYNNLKMEIEKYIPADFDKDKTIWNLDFASCTLEVTEQ